LNSELACINQCVAVAVVWTNRLIVGNLDKLGHRKWLRHSLKAVDGVKRSCWLAGALPKSFVASRRSGQLEKLLSLRLVSLWINNDSLQLRGILDKRAGIDNGKINVDGRMLLKRLRSR
jgi:hypothetical protein